MMKSNIIQLKSRGYIEDNDLEGYLDFSKEELLKLLFAEMATKRTISARMLINFKSTDIIEALISRLLVEKKLYTKIALSESLEYYGEEASSLLIQYLGKVGVNQYKELPIKEFGKSNYPLPRDIISRTICRIGLPGLKHLRVCLFDGNYEQILEAVDAIGFISFYGDDNSCLPDLLVLLDKYKEDELMTWKLIRSLQAFREANVLDILEGYINSSIEQHRWESMRSIQQIKKHLNIL